MLPFSHPSSSRPFMISPCDAPRLWHGLTALVLLAAPGRAASAQTNLEWATPQGGSETHTDDGAMSGPGDDARYVPGLPTDPTAVPIDGGLVFLALAGGGLAAKRLRDRRTAREGDASAL